MAIWAILVFVISVELDYLLFAFHCTLLQVFYLVHEFACPVSYDTQVALMFESDPLAGIRLFRFNFLGSF